MKIKIGELRRIIREALVELEEDAVPPGKWAANSVAPARGQDLDRLGEDDLDDEDAE